MGNWRRSWRSLLTRLVRWWKRLWQNLWRNGKRDRSLFTSDSRENSGGVPLSYSHYEFLFHQLLEGVATEGWKHPEVTDFLDRWSDRTTEIEWLRWLERFGERVFSSPAPNLELARRMVKLSEVVRGDFARRAGEIGVGLLERPKELELEEPNLVVKPKLEPPVEPVEPPPKESLPTPPPAKKATVPLPLQRPQPTKPLPAATPAQTPLEAPSFNSLEGILSLLKHRPQMAGQLAKQMGIETTDPDDILRQLEVRALIKSSLKYQQQGKLRQAMTYVENAIALNENYGMAWGIKGDLLFRLNRFEASILAYDRAIDLNPNDEQAWYNRGMAQFKLECFERALSNFEHALELEETLYPAWKNKAICLLNVGRYQEALAACDRALHLQPDDPVVQTCREQAEQEMAGQ